MQPQESTALMVGWTPECQRTRWFQHTNTEWYSWIAGLLAGGFGRYTQEEWMEWCASMNALHGPSGGAPVLGVRGDVLR